MEKPLIYVLHSASVIGSLVPPTKIEEVILCDQCGIKQQPKEYKKVHYKLIKWDGEDIMQAESIFLVSNRLKEALENNNGKGYLFEKVEIIKDTYFEMGQNVWSDTIPQFWLLVITQRCKGPEIWWKKVPCKDCEKKKWDITPEGIISIAVPFNSEPVPARTVFFNSWNGADIFYLEDPDSPIITQKIATVLKQFNCEVNLLESGWE